MRAARLVVISNRKSARSSGSLKRIHALLDDYRGKYIHRVIDEICEISDVLEEFASFEPDVLVINGGDGTIQAVLTQSSRNKPFGELPPILVLPGGKTNLVAEDLGAFELPERVLADVLPMLEEGGWQDYLTDRPLIRLRLSPEAEPIYGAFFGTAAVVRGLAFVRKHIHPLNLPNWATHFVAIAALTGCSLFYRNGKRSPMRADHVAVSIDNTVADHGRYSLIIATTLNRLLLGLRPFPADQSRVAMKVTTIQYEFAAVVRGIYAVLSRAIDREVPRGTVAREARSMTLSLDCPVTLDGEFFFPEPDKPVEISVTRAVTFLKSSG